MTKTIKLWSPLGICAVLLVGGISYFGSTYLWDKLIGDNYIVRRADDSTHLQFFSASEKAELLEKIGLQGVELLDFHADLFNVIADEKDKQLFTIDDFLDADTSPKEVIVDIEKVLHDSFGAESDILTRIQKAYHEMGIDIKFNIVDKIDYSSLKHAEHLAFAITTPKKLSERGERSERDDEFFASASLKDSICLVNLKLLSYYIDLYQSNAKLIDDMKRMKQTYDLVDLKYDNAETHKQEIYGELHRLIASKLAHEIGHLFGLYHPTAFSNDPIGECGFLPNCMVSQFDKVINSGELCCTFSQLQQRMMHSYLSKGKVYKAFEAVGFNLWDYVFLTGFVNGYHFEKL